MDGLLNLPEIVLLKSVRVTETTLQPTIKGSCANKESIPARHITG